MLRAAFNTVHTAFHRPGTDLYRWVNALVWTLIFVSVGLLLVEILWGLDFSENSTLRTVDDFILVIFAFEIALRILSLKTPSLDFFVMSRATRIRSHFRSRFMFAMEPLNLIDLFTVLALVPELRALRALRLLRLLRTAPLFRHSDAFGRIARGFLENRLAFYFAIGLVGLEVLLGGISLYLAEIGSEGTTIESIADGFWWALVTVTTVGYGDITPVSSVGRMLGSVLMVGGMFTLALFAGIVGHTFISILMTLREDQYRMASYIDHIVICGYSAGSDALLKLLLKEVGQGTEMVIMAPGERDQLVPPEFAWVRGDPSKEAELEKVRLTHASAVLVIGHRGQMPQHADATTIMTIFTLRRCLANTTIEHARARPLYIVAEILEEENVEHAKAAGADEVIDSGGVSSSLLAHALAVHGSARIMSLVACQSELNLYVGRQPEPRGDAPTFGVLLQRLKQSYGVLLIGLRDPVSGDEALNPAADHVVAPDAQLIYLAGVPVLPLLAS